MVELKRIAGRVEPPRPGGARGPPPMADPMAEDAGFRGIGKDNLNPVSRGPAEGSGFGLAPGDFVAYSRPGPGHPPGPLNPTPPTKP